MANFLKGEWDRRYVGEARHVDYTRESNQVSSWRKSKEISMKIEAGALLLHTEISHSYSVVPFPTSGVSDHVAFCVPSPSLSTQISNLQGFTCLA